MEEEKDVEEEREAGGICAAKTLNIQTHIHGKINLPRCFHSCCVAHKWHNGN